MYSSNVWIKFQRAKTWTATVLLTQKYYKATPYSSLFDLKKLTVQSNACYGFREPYPEHRREVAAENFLIKRDIKTKTAFRHGGSPLKLARRMRHKI